jgi:hypothetical protein
LLLSDAAFGLTTKEVRVLVGHIARDRGLNAARLGGKRWMGGFIRRNHELSLRKPGSAVKGRLINFNREATAKWWKVARPILQSYHPREIFNKDDMFYNSEKDGQLKVRDSGAMAATASIIMTLLFVPPSFLMFCAADRGAQGRGQRQEGGHQPRQSRAL